jgi:hypothetical protein
MLAGDLKPMDTGNLIDKSFKMFFSTMKKNFKITSIFMGVCTAILAISGLAIYSTVYSNYGGFKESNDYDKIIPQILIAIPFLILFSVIFVVSLVFFYGMIHDLYIDVFQDKEWDFKKSFIHVKNNFWAIVLSGFVFFMFSAVINSCCCVLFPLSSFLAVSIPSILYENTKVEGIGRSFKLVSYSFWNVIGVKLLYILILMAFTVVTIVITSVVTVLLLAVIYALNLVKSTDTDNSVFITCMIFAIFYIPSSFFSGTLECALNVSIFFNQKIKYENFGIEILTESIVNEGLINKN